MSAAGLPLAFGRPKRKSGFRLHLVGDRSKSLKGGELDEKHGLSISFEERTPDAYAAQFNSGEFKLGGSAALLTVGLADIRGVKVTYLFNLFDYWGAVVTSKPEVKTLKDLEGKDLVAAKGTTNYVIFEWFARQLGVDTGTFSVVNT